jgi:hypothetical protein
MWDCRRFVAGYVSRQYFSVPRVRSGMLYISRSRGGGSHVARDYFRAVRHCLMDLGGTIPVTTSILTCTGESSSWAVDTHHSITAPATDVASIFVPVVRVGGGGVSRTTTNHRPTAKSELEHRFRSDWSLCPKTNCVAYSCVSTWWVVGGPNAGRNRWAQEIGPRGEMSGTASNYGHQSSGSIIHYPDRRSG